MDQKTAPAFQSAPSAPMALTADQRRRMREAAEAAAREAPGEWHTGDTGPEGNCQGFYQVIAGRGRLTGDAWAVLLTINPFFSVEPISRHVVETQPAAVLALLDRLDYLESELDDAEKDRDFAERVATIQLRKAEKERDALLEKLAAAERRVAELEERGNDRRKRLGGERESGDEQQDDERGVSAAERDPGRDRCVARSERTAAGAGARGAARRERAEPHVQRLRQGPREVLHAVL